MFSLDSLGNLDVWTEVLKYLEISLEHDSEPEIEDKRRALLRVALLSPSLTTPALDVLWRSMNSLEPITHVFNSKTNGPDDSILGYFSDAWNTPENHWWLASALNSDDRDRVCEYLARIRHMRARVGYVKEMELWTMLNNILGVVLPNLHSLSLDFSQVSGFIGDWINTIGPLLSPVLRSVSFQNVSDTHARGTDTLLACLKSRSLVLTKISYHGFPSSSLLQNCLSFDSLETLKLKSKFYRSPIQRYTIGPSIFKVFEGLPKLKELEIDLRVFLFRSLGDTSSDMHPSMSLETLCIAGDAEDMNRFFRGVRSPSLLSLSVAIFQSNGLSWKVVCDRIVSNFPKLHSLCFRRAGDGVQELLMQDLSALLSRNTMQSLELDGISHCFNEINIGGMLDSWPTLHTLSITNDTPSDTLVHFSASVLTKISQATHLRHVKLPLELSDLGIPLLHEPVAVSRSLVKALTIASISNQPSNLEGKIEVACNLLILFPMLESLFASSPHQAYIAELERLVKSYRRMIVTYLQRTESEERTAKRKAVSKTASQQ